MELPCVAFCHLEKSWVDINDKLIAVANPCGYKITLYDFELNVVDLIKPVRKKDWKDIQNNILPFETNLYKVNPKTVIDNLLLMQDTISRIEKIFFINRSTLLVSWTGIGCLKNKRKIDVWKIKNRVNSTNSGILTSINYADSDTINLNNVPISLNDRSNIKIENNIVYTINDEDFIPEKDMTVKEFNHLKDLYYEKYDPQFTIGIYKIILP